MKWAENNPVVSAFGIWNSDSGRRTIKFLQGIRVPHHDDRQSFDDFGNNNNNDNDRHSVISGYTESVITIGSNGNFGGGGYGINSKFGYRNSGNANDHSRRPRRRRQPLPEDITQNDSAPDSAYGGMDAMSANSAMPPPSYSKPALEWDVFLDPNLVRQVDAAMTVADELELVLRKVRIKRERRRQAKKKSLNGRQIMRETHRQHGQPREFNRPRSTSGSSNHTTIDRDADEDDDDDDDNDEDFDILQSHTAAQVEVDRLVSQLMRRTIIAHGSMSQLVLEAMGVAPKYNFGTVVKSSREGVASMGRAMGERLGRATAVERSSATGGGFSGGASVGVGNGGRGNNIPPSPSRSIKRVSLRAGNTEFSLDISQTYSWDDEEEQRDFEALLDPTVSRSKAGKGGERRRGTAKTSGGSKGMFMETWIHVFARTLSLLVKSSNSGGATSGIAKKSSSSSSRSNDDVGALLVKNRPANIGQRGISGLLEKMFLRRDSSCRDAGKQHPGATSWDEVEAADESREDTMGKGNGLRALDYYDDDSELLTNNDMFSPTTPTTSSFGMCGMSLCMGYEDNDPSGGGSSSTFPLNPHASHKMAQDIDRISTILNEPLRLVLDLKSRRVPPRVWSRLIDSLRTRGLIIEGIGSFDYDELRVIRKGCSYPLTPMLFFHSVGDLQRACHANEVKNGDTVYFNGGSLMWKRSSIMEAAERGCCGAIETDVDDYAAHVGGGAGGIGAEGVSPRSFKASGGGAGANGAGNYSFQPYAYPRSALSDWERTKCKSTIEDYRRHFNLKIGVYVQEFSISAEALDALSIFVNKQGDIYDQGLAFGGVNGTAVKNIHGDGYWNQRYMGRSWDFDARPSKEMTPLKPEDHHLVQKAIQAGAWGQVGTIYEVMDEKAGALTVPPPREPCNMVNTF